MQYDIRDGILYFDGCNTTLLAKEFGTPLYVMSKSIIERKFAEIKNNFLNKYSKTKACYASKAFLNLAMVKMVDEANLHLDVVSGGELYTALKANFPMDKVYFHGNNKSLEEIEMAIKNNVGTIVVDNFYELHMINEISTKYDKKTNILFRVTPGVNAQTHKYISTGQKDSKFGIPIIDDIIYSAIKLALEYQNINLLGFHMHVGSQLFDNFAHLGALEVVLDIVKNANNRYGFITKELNVGGGFGINYNDGDKAPLINYFIDPIMKKIYEYCKAFYLNVPTVIIEPGRYVVGEAGLTLYTIGAIKDIPNVRTYVSIDGGMPDNLRPSLYGAKYQAMVCNKANIEKNLLATIAGKCCESGDILIWDALIPKVVSGDLLAVFSTGAYNYSMSSNYNRLKRPAVVLVKENKAELIVKRETYKDILRNDLIPSSLKGCD